MMEKVLKNPDFMHYRGKYPDKPLQDIGKLEVVPDDPIVDTTNITDSLDITIDSLTTTLPVDVGTIND